MIKNSSLNKSKFPSGFAPFKYGKKNKLSEYFSARFWDSHFYVQKKSSLWISPKMLKKTERPNLAVCGSLCGEKQFLLIFILHYWLVQKQLFKQIQILLRICPFSNMVRKTNFLSISVLVSEIITFMSKKKSSLYEFPQKCFRTTESYSLAIYGSLCGEKQFMFIFIPFNWCY